MATITEEKMQTDGGGALPGTQEAAPGMAVKTESGEVLVMPYHYAEDEVYEVEPLGKIPFKPFYSFVKRTCDIVA